MSQLERIAIDTGTDHLHQIHYFLTYAANYVGEEHLKKHVEVYIYGDSKKLNLNLYNLLYNLCKCVKEYQNYKDFT